MKLEIEMEDKQLESMVEKIVTEFLKKQSLLRFIRDEVKRQIRLEKGETDVKDNM